MSISLTIEQKTVFALLSDKNSCFLIPDYQRPYAWEENECATLWNDILSFAFPDNNCDVFDDDDVYFLGPIVLFTNSDKKLEVIDGQQRLTTLMLLLRAFYHAYGNDMKDSKSLAVKSKIEQCLWKTNAFGEPNMSALKIESETATDNDKDEFKTILLTGEAAAHLKSRYAENYRFFQDKISGFKATMPDYFSFLPIRILGNCILLPIKAESQDTALRIFSTLNDRGKPLSDSDIFKAQLYKAFSDDGLKDEFIADWKNLENLCGKIFQLADNPMDEIFTRYMYFERAKRGVRVSTLEGLRKFYEADNYSLLRKYHHQTFSNIKALADFWNDVANQDRTKFSERVLRRLFVLNYAPNSMWTYITSVYFLQNRDSDGLLDDDDFYEFLTKITAFTLMYTMMGNGVVQFRAPVFSEMANIIHAKEVTFAKFAPSISGLENALKEYIFSNSKPITKAILAWYAFNDNAQELIRPLETEFQIEHIYAKNRTPYIPNVDDIGNKSILESNINIRAADYQFQDKAKYYLGLIKNKPATNIHELQSLASTITDFTAHDISQRTEKIISAFINFIKENGLAR